MFEWLRRRLLAIGQRREPDFIIGGADAPYLRRWWVIPRNPLFNIYLHQFLRDDDDRALHDHPWANCSVLLEGAYTEHQIRAGGIHVRARRVQGDWYFRPLGTLAHRIEVNEGPCWTLFITGPVYREWGFHCPGKGWVPWKVFTAARDGKPGEIGRGCE